MRWFKRTTLRLVAIVVLLLGIGLILPSTFKVQRSIEVLAASANDDALCFPDVGVRTAGEMKLDPAG